MVMSKQQQAPGDLEHVRAFVNTRDIDLGTDDLERPEGLSSWLQRNGLLAGQKRVTASELARAVRVREAVRAILLAHNGGGPAPADAAAALDAAACRARLRLRFGETGATRLESQAHGVDAALGGLLSIIHESIADGTWQRLKACRSERCEWAFYDHTKNHSGAWCSMASCGNREKARTYRERHGTRD